MKNAITLIALLAIALAVAPSRAHAQQSITVTISFDGDGWDALTNKLARINADAAAQYTNTTFPEWQTATNIAAKLKAPPPPMPPAPVPFTPETYIAAFATRYVRENTRPELTKIDRDAGHGALDALPPAKLKEALRLIKGL